MCPSPLANPNNTLGLDYELRALEFPPIASGITDVHSHLRGHEVIEIYNRVARAYGVSLTYSMTPLADLGPVRERLGERIRFIAFPDMLDVMSEGRVKTGDWLSQIEQFHDSGARMIKFWAGPRGVDYETGPEEAGRFALRAPHRIEAARHAAALGMYTMVHVGDPDVWFDKKYTDPNRYGTKLSQYEPLEDYLHEYPSPCIAAHMGGWPENLEFLDALLTRHPNLYLDMSATKWMVRELSRHSDEALVKFLRDWEGRILFGSDVVIDDGLLKTQSKQDVGALIASRYWSLRTMLETNYDGPSPIADADAVEPIVRLRGRSLPPDLLQTMYHGAAYNLLEPLYSPRRSPPAETMDSSGAGRAAHGGAAGRVTT